ncbi:hypothetical protein TD95_005194 [Thielaviopsis punctulata]|uniref:Pyridoxamine 5'-phosphate oxidase Alr4036 family FMN-binding domain-containing protein n=1 Tax=Thielaviopsis punctulata TaxID=72032 RepID=A0A0F4ZHE0_9PEZI|nr:hypothetical protein TD95_005194 [Thielaviopsis punctulata]
MSSNASWRAALQAQLSSTAVPAFTLSTLANTPAGPAPRARTVVFRGFLADLPANPRNRAPRNPDLWTSDVLTITTDARMAKATELSGPSSSSGGGSDGGGGVFEAVFWAPGWTQQWRVRGTGYVLSRTGPADDQARQVLEGRMRRRTGEGGLEGWDWAREVTAHFGNLSAGMRGSFRNPAPGGAVVDGPGGEGLGLGQEVYDLQDEVARENFRVVGLVPHEVDYVSLEDPKRAQRWMYKLEEGEWKEQEVWP